MNRCAGVMAFVALLVTLLAGQPPTAAAAPTEGLPIQVRVTDITSVLGPGEDLELRVELENSGTTDVAAPRVVVRLSRSSFISRYSLDRWRSAGADESAGTPLLSVDAPGPLRPGGSTSVTLTVPASSIALPTRFTSWGPRGLAVQVLDQAGTQLGLVRTFLLWFPDQEVTTTRVSVQVPIAGPRFDPHDDAWVFDLEQATAPGGRLNDLVAATDGGPVATWVIDPWLLEAAAEGGPVAQAWADDVLAGMVDREIQLLPYLDPDLAALAHAGSADLLNRSIARAEAAARSSGLPDAARVSLAWPADSLPDLTTAAFVTRDERRAVLVGPGELLAPEVLTYTPTGRTTVTTAGEDLVVLVPDERLSAAFVNGAVGVATGVEDPQLTPATSAQDLLAELAVITRERPTDGRHMLATVPRDWAPDVERVAAQLQALAEAPWVRTEPISALVGAPDPGIDRGTLPGSARAEDEIEAGRLVALQEAVAQRAQLAQMLADPATAVGDADRELLAPAAVSWRTDPLGRSAVLVASDTETQQLRAGVLVQPGGAVNLISSSGGLPVQVRNTLDQAVRIQVGLRPGDSRLVAENSMTITIEPGEEALVQVPVHAVQSGDVEVTVVLQTTTGVVIDDNTRFTVRVRAAWEGIGTAVGAGLLAVALVLGLIRTIRRGRTARRSRRRPEAGPDTLSPEVVAEAAEDVTA